jgi:hypothetical protein
MKNLNRSRFVVVGILALALSSCLEISQSVHLKEDGSGTISEETIFGAEASAMLQMAEQQGGGKQPNMFGEESAKKRAEAFGKGVTVAKVEKIDKDGRMGSRVVYHFADINTVTLGMSDSVAGMSDMAPSGAEEKVKEKNKPMTFTYADGTLMVNLPKPKKEDVDAAKAELPAAAEGPDAAQMQAMAMQMFKDMKMSVKLTIEPGIAETDATHREGDTITLMEADFGKLMANPDAAKKLQGLDMKDPAAMENALKGIDGIKGEAKEKVTVKVK